MSKVKLTITRYDEFEINVDESIWNDQTMEDWSEIFSKVETVNDVAEYFAKQIIIDEDYKLPTGITVLSRNEDAIARFENDSD